MDGRRAQAARNDTAILEAARAVYAADPEAPIAAAEAALADDGDAWKVFRRYMTRVVEADAYTLSFRLAIALEKDSEALWRDATKAQDLRERVFKRAQKGGAVRGDAVPEDIGNIFQQLSAIRGPSAKRTQELRKRYLTLQLDGLRPRKKAQQFPGPPPRVRDRASA